MLEAPPQAGDEGVILSAADLLATPEEFVASCAAAFGLDAVELPAHERAALVEALENGRSRLAVVAALRRRAAPLAADGRPAPRLDESRLAGLARSWTNEVVVDELLRYAPEDDGRFVEQAFRQIFGRDATPIESLEARFDLRGRRLDRRAMIETLAARSPGCRLSPPAAARPVGTIDGGPGLRDDGAAAFTLAREAPGAGWIIAPGALVQQMSGEDGAFAPAPGWVLRARGLTPAPGRWRLDVDLVQDDGETIVLDVVANAGLDELLRLELQGPARFAAAVTVSPGHHFIEVRALKPGPGGRGGRLKIRDLSLVRVF